MDSKEFLIEFNRQHRLLFPFKYVFGLRICEDTKTIAIQLTSQPQTFSKLEVDGELTWQLQFGSNQIANTTDLPVPMDVDPIDHSNVKLYPVATALNSRTSTNRLISKLINFCSTESVLAGAVAQYLHKE